jgi:hypothetical protein
MSTNLTVLTLAQVEANNLAQLVDEFRGLIAASSHAHDPAVARLTPDVYPGDSEASAAFAQSTRAELLDRREQDAAQVRDALEAFATDTDTDHHDTDAPDPYEQVRVVISETELPAWLRTLAAIRLVLASRLGIIDDDDHEPDDPRYLVYDWLGYRLEGLVTAHHD